MNPTSETPVIVAVGASAGGLEALSQLVATIDASLPYAFVILQHLSPNYRSMMVEILSRETQLDVKEAAQGDKVLAGIAYIVPAYANASIKNGHLQLTTTSPDVVPKPSINQFFMSLAGEERERAVGILLSGTGSDGVSGLRAIQIAGGITIAQLPETAKYDGMPQAAINEGVADYILPPDKIIQKINHLLSFPEPEELLESQLIRDLLVKLKQHMKQDFSGYKTSTLLRRVHRRMVATENKDLKSYVDWTDNHPEEFELLSRDILISVTSFFRDVTAFDALAIIIRDLCDSRAPGAEFRVWVAGCATGEEAYSIAIMFSEALGDKLGQYRVQIFATDIDEEAINIARRGIYPAQSVRGIDEARLQRFFQCTGKEYEVNKLLRDMIMFARHNLVSDPPFLKLDIVSCRNVMIYFDTHLQAKVLRTFHFGLTRDGFLFLGKSENISQAEAHFSPLKRRERLFTKVGESRPAEHHEPAIGAKGTFQRRDRKTELFLNTLADHFHVTAALCDTHGIIQHTVGHVDRFLSFPVGSTRLVISDVVVEPLQGEMLALLHRCQKSKKRVFGRKRRIGDELLRICIEPASDGVIPMSIVIFEPVSQPSDELHPGAIHVDPDETLESELVATRENMQTLVEELATANEEMQALNEEAQAANEELQATNEELEAANEELQASNQELVSVNEELNIKSFELTSLNAEYSHLYDALEFPILVFDQEGLLSRYNAVAGRRFDLRPSLISQAVAELRLPEALRDIESLIDSVIAESDRASRILEMDQTTYHLMVAPGFDHNGAVVTIVITLVDVSEVVETKAR
ncbi:CheR family methyltransferase [Magnetofaba australis]|uniref:Putative chemotaxis protein n=1 Tax=Magnetofaba australis IT-1 TaxID=1434232 RepID=A0A1Y2KAX7_9PROT|nr:CheR family methyltransferase [Magnetofaba australis]OSM08733.1 putative chemotaxis protein [Magnetofaba australis IT-1]